jgi:type I restriction enzyme S subunit
MRVRPTTLDEYLLPIPSVSEQQRIVAAIESYLTRLDNAVALLERVEENLKRYRASVLKAAVEGRLVPTEAELARREGRSYEPASELLKRILAERKTRWIEDAAEKARAKAEEKARKAGQPWTAKDDTAALDKERAKAAKQYKEPAAPDTTDLPDLPEGWCWASVEQLGETVTGGTPPTSGPEYYGGGLPFVKPTDLDVGDAVVTARQFLTPAGAAVSRPVPPGSILVTCIGATIGKTGLARVTCATNQQINALVPEDAVRASRYLYWLFASPYGQEAVVGNASSTTLPILNKGRFEKLPLPVPPIGEQARIVEAVERTLSTCGSIQTQANTVRAKGQRLRQSILKWAFEGKLVEQDPNDEPASALLERIRVERVAAPKARGRKKETAE